MIAKKNKWLFVVLVVVIIANIGFLMLPDKGSSISFREDLFRVSDTSAVERIILGKGANEVVLLRQNNDWVLNESKSTDQGLVRMLLSILNHVTVTKPVSVDVRERLPVSIRFEDGRILYFEVFGNAMKTKTYFSADGQAYEVEIPGYRDYLAGIFELKADQWRDRVIFDGSWRTIQRLRLDYSDNDENDFEILFNEKFFQVAGIPRMDSSSVVEYLNEFQNWKANERLSKGRMPRYDSLAKTDPYARLAIESINYTTDHVFSIYAPIKNDGFVLVTNQDGEMMVIDRKRISRILLKKEDFKLE